MKIFKRLTKSIMALGIMIAMVITTTLPAFADMRASIYASGSAAWGRCGQGFTIGLGICDKELYTGYGGDADALAAWIYDYSSRWYTPVVGDSVFIPLQGTTAINKPNGSSTTVASGTLAAVLSEIGHGGNYLEHTTGDLYQIKEDKIQEVMLACATLNPALYAQWQNQVTKTNFHPVVIVVESYMALLTSDGNRWLLTTSDYANYVGAGSALLNTNYAGAADDGASGPEGGSQTGLVIADYIGLTNIVTGDEGPNRIHKGQFGIAYNGRPHGGTDSNGFGFASHLAVQPGNHKITGCSVINAGNIETTDLSGSYTWHIDAEDIPVTGTAGHAEDGSADVGEGTTSIMKNCKVNAFDLSQTTYGAWYNYFKKNGLMGSSITVTGKVYSVGCSDGTNNFTTEFGQVYGSDDGLGYVSTDTRTLQWTGSGAQLLKYMEPENTDDFPIFNNAINNNEVLGSTMTDGTLAIAYATDLVVNVPGYGSVPFSNQQTHYAIYGHDDGRTYKFMQQLDNAYTQVKSGESLGNSTYEAMAGTPTTENLFITQGGEQWVVNMQYRYCNDDYIREYQVKTKEPVANYMFYKTGGSNSDSDIESNTESFPSGSQVDPYGTSKGNYGYHKDSSTRDTNQTSKYRAKVLTAINAWNTLFNGIDNNYKANPGSYVYDYDVIVTGGSFANPVVVGRDAAKVAKTKEQIKEIYDWLQAKKTATISGMNAIDDYDFDEETITFCETTSGQDFDSNVAGIYTVSFVFNTSSTKRYNYPTQTYCREHTVDVSGSCSVCGYSGTGGGYSHVGVGACSEHQTVPATFYSGSTVYDAFGNPVPNQCTGHGFIGHATPCYHYPEKGTNGAYTYSYKHYATGTITELWEAKMDWTLSTDIGQFTESTDNRRGKYLSEDSTIKQTFENVKYMDIVSCHVWRLVGGAEKGLTSILCQQQQQTGNDDTAIITAVCQAKGYTLYDVTHTKDFVGSWETGFTSKLGKESNKVWRCIENTELQSIGRLANSWNAESVAQSLPSLHLNAYVDGNEHALKLVGSTDKVTLEYDIAEQGGTSHHSFDGFMLQAMAITFYQTQEAKTAYKNTIALESDYVSIIDSDGVPLTMNAFQFNAFDYMMDNTEGASHGLTYAILSSQSDAVSKYRKPATFWAKDPVLLNANSNTTKGIKSVALTKGELKPLETYAENEGIVELDYSPIYGALQKAQICEGNNAPYNTSWLAIGLAEKGGMARVGYEGDCKGFDASTHEPQGARCAAQSFKPDATFVNGGYNGLLFDNWGCLTYGNKLEIDAGFDAGSPVPNASAKTYPHTEGWNVARNYINGEVATGWGAVIYEKCLARDTAMEGILSMVLYSAGFSDANDELTVAVKQSVFPVPSSKGTTMRTLGQIASSGIVHGAGYQSSEAPVNSIVIYNPSTSESASLIKPTDKLPDAANILRDTNGDGVIVTNDEDTATPNDADGYAIRDQREAPYYITVTGDETYISGTSLASADIDISNGTYTYSLRQLSRLATSYYTADDYTRLSNTTDLTYTVTPENGEGIMSIEQGGNYKLTLFDVTGKSTSVTTNLSVGDMLITNGESLYVRKASSTGLQCTWENLYQAITAYYDAHVDEQPEDYKGSDYVKVTNTANLNIDLSSLSLSPGGVVKLSLTFDKPYNNPANVRLFANATECVVTTYQTSQDNITWDYYFEVNKATSLTNLNITFNQNATLPKVDWDIASACDIWLMDVGSEWGDPAYAGTTIEHEWDTRSQCYVLNATRSRSYNSLAVDILQATASIQSVRKDHVLYVSTSKENVNATLKASALANPHKVYNSNWRYYVLGWVTSTGTVITSVNDELLSRNTTLLKWPGVNEYVTVETLRNQACVVMWKNKIYLTLKGDGLNHRISQLGYEVDQYDKWSLGNGGAFLPINGAASGNYPLVPALGNDITANYDDYIYEFFFNCTDYDAPVFYVGKASNTNYRFLTTDTASTEFSPANWEADWIRTQTASSRTATKLEGASLHVGDYVSLDDEFTIYFDNVGAIPGDGAKDISSVHSTLGEGWNHGYPDTDVRDSSGIYNWMLTAYGNPQSVTECSKWIYRKYITFEMDVYAFTNHAVRSSGLVNDLGCNPTLTAFNDDGSANDLVFIPAGTKVYLGTYSTNSEDSDNSGQFADLGAPGITKDKRGNPYQYHFWCPLSAGEAVAKRFNCYSENINATEFGPLVTNGQGDANASPAPATYRMFNQNKNNVPIRMGTERYHDSCTTGTFDVVGRIGALTIVESGDPRYSDSFKNATTTTDYLIYPIVRKIASYSNIPNAHGTQLKYVLDPFDVRGRIASTALKSQWLSATTNNAANSAYTTYTGSGSGGGYNTYGTQWFKRSDNTVVPTMLPLTPSFNIHPELQATEQKIGYELYLSLESIGSYLGESIYNMSGTTSNVNNDYNQYKVQVRPVYFGLDTVTNSGQSYTGPVDVYMRKGSSYVKINTGSTVPSKYLNVLYDSYFPAYLDTNTGSNELDLDQNMKRRMVTDAEASTTKTVLDWMNTNIENNRESLQELNASGGTFGVTSLLSPFSFSTGFLGGTELSSTYTCGNSQFLFLRERNRTFVGGASQALYYKDEAFLSYIVGQATASPSTSLKYAMRNGQKWYFGMGLPSSAIFVPTGMELATENILKTGFVLSTVDVYAQGDVWLLHYKSAVSRMNLSINGAVYDYKTWNKLYNDLPWLVPVSYYDLSDSTSRADLSTEGSH